MKRLGKGNWLFGHVLDLWRDPLQTFANAYSDSGPVPTLRIGPTKLHLVCHPDHIQHVLLTNNRNYLLNQQVMPLARAIMGNNIVTSDGEFWAKHRRILQPAFAADSLVQFAQPVVSVAQEMLDRWHVKAKENGVVDIAEELRLLSLRIGACTLIGSDLSEGEEKVIANGITEGMKYFAYRTRNPFALPLSVPSPYNAHVKRVRGNVYSLIDSFITKRRQSPAKGMDLLQRLIDARDPLTAEGLTDVEIRFESIGALTAASETTANALSWTLLLLAKHPEELQIVRDEVTHVLNGRVPQYGDLANLQHTRQALEEGMRLYPPTWVMGRTSVAVDQIGSKTIPAGSHLAISSSVTHRLEEFWESPHEYRPQRFEASQAASRHRFAYFPFGGGPRACIGRYLAMLEMPLILAMIVQNFEWELIKSEVRAEPQISLRPRDGIPVRLNSIVN